jgi:hypothetical protein
LIETVILACMTPTKTPVASDESDEKKSLRRSWKSSGPVAKLTVVFAGVAAAATVAYVLIAASQLYVMSGQLSQMQQTLDQNKTANARELRPYVSVNKMELLGELKDGQIVHGKVDVTNSGRTPAIGLQGCADLVIKPNSEPITDAFPCPAPNNPGAKLQPTGERSVFALGSGNPFTLMTTGTSISPVDKLLPILSSGGLRLYLYGDISYSDLISPENVHHSTFCGRYNPATKGFDVCEKHNRMD